LKRETARRPERSGRRAARAAEPSPPGPAAPDATLDLLSRLAALHPEASRRSLKQWLAAGRVRVNGRVERRAGTPLAPGDRVALGAPEPEPLPGGLRRVYENERLVVVDKPAGLLTIASASERERTAYRLLWAHLEARAPARDRRPSEIVPSCRRQPVHVVHRLDRETSGLLVFARTPAAKRFLQEQFERRTVERVYVAVVQGRVREESGTLRMRLREDAGRRVHVARGEDGREAITHYRVLGRGADTTRLEIRLETGRRGQIRAHLAALGHPIVGDAAYGSDRDPLGRVCLHATRLGFEDTDGPLRFDSPPPRGFSAL